MKRAAAVAGAFYPDEPTALHSLVRECLAAEANSARPVDENAAAAVHAVIAPHAGYVYSGPVAGSAYRALPASVHRVLLVGPAHYWPLAGLATHSAEWFSTPLGDVPVDLAARDRLESLPGVERCDRAHDREHSLEVQLPFLQSVLDDFEVLPVLVDEVPPAEVTAAYEAMELDDETLIVVSSDLSHYLEYDEALERDTETARNIVALREDRIASRDACGRCAIAGLLHLARAHGWMGRLLDLRNSGDTEGDPARVVGYGAFAFG